VSLFSGKRKDGGPDPRRTDAEPEVRPTTTQVTPPSVPAPAPASAAPERRLMDMAPPKTGGGGDVANIGKSIVIKGDLSGNEDLVIEGKVEGKVDLPNNRLTIGAGGQVSAQVHAKNVVVIGRVAGNVSAGERLEIQATGIVEGDVEAPRLIVAEGAVLNGSVKMSAKGAAAQARPSTSTSPSTGASTTPLASTGNSQTESARLI
jgi:cytoskeletal protein CcmA (bactofilin family)